MTEPEVVDLTACVLAGCQPDAHRCKNPTQKAGGDDDAGGKGGLPVRPDAEPSTGEPASEPPAATHGWEGRVRSALPVTTRPWRGGREEETNDG